MDLGASLAIGIGEGSKFLPFSLACSLLLRVARFPDVGVQGAYSLGAATLATTVANGVDPVVGMGLAVAVGFATGLLTATLFLKARLNSLICGIVTSLVAYTATFITLGASAVRSVDTFTSEATIGVAGLVLAAGMTALFATRRGLVFRMAGASPNLLDYLGTDSRVAYGSLLVVGNVMVAVSGALVTGVTGVVNIRSGDPLLFIGITMLIMGEGTLTLMSLLVPKRARSEPSWMSALTGSGTLWYFLAAVLGSYVYWIGFVLAAALFGANEYSPALFAGIAILLLIAARRLSREETLLPAWTFR